MKTKTINCYLFTELNEEQQQKVIDKNRDYNLDYMDDLTEFDEIYAMTLEEQGFLNPKIYYDLSYCQGSGACFETDEFDFNILLKDFECPHKTWIINIIKDHCEARIMTNSYSNYYMHARTRYFDINYTYEIDYDSYPRIADLIGKIDNYIEHKRLEACGKLYEQLEAEYEYLTSDEAIKEQLIANEYYFNECSLDIESI